ncbi:MAG: hypothetical protein COA96_01935 [SAR86 cluster bacterium]|uniref:Uncharacterized protein n=1 Tax=SAR86 cluster bacterium TaxID=2030880 RepID=A0A2A5B8Q7_9GAMM|nr:MAG: hypothetical protein COA96_01935 [SAR86 cluster bacterium]
MNEPQWDDSIEEVNDIFEAAAIMPNIAPRTRLSTVESKTQLTELRRRIEERLDSKRIAHEFEYDEVLDSAQSA